jgi:hypothetical protein
MKNSSDTIGNRNRDLPVCSAVPQPTGLPRDPQHTYPALKKWNCTSCHMSQIYPSRHTLNAALDILILTRSSIYHYIRWAYLKWRHSLHKSYQRLDKPGKYIFLHFLFSELFTSFSNRWTWDCIDHAPLCLRAAYNLHLKLKGTRDSLRKEAGFPAHNKIFFQL